MDIGFKQAGFTTVWANEFDRKIAKSYQNYFKDVNVDTRSILKIDHSEIPKNVVGVVGGPPCQSWSQGGSRRGIEDPRGQLFIEYLKVINYVKPTFFVAENVSGLTHQRNERSFQEILRLLAEIGYRTSWKLLNSSDYEVPQDRKRVIIVGYKNSLKKTFEFPEPVRNKRNLNDAIGDIKHLKIGSKTGRLKNHELIESGYSPIFLSRNRVRNWDEQSFTILATERHIPFHPSAPKMIKKSKDVMALAEGQETSYRRLTVRECARIQTFPDDYEFLYDNIKTGYKMIGNAVPVKLAFHIAKKIREDLEKHN